MEPLRWFSYNFIYFYCIIDSDKIKLNNPKHDHKQI
jgi:hypothetical protein